MPAQRITRELLLRRAEHNDGDLATLREITLHQFDLERIELLDVYCRQLRIVFLQNNQITKIENVGKLKDLEYLNLALNNIVVIENLQTCEMLRKLDLTVNFVDDLFCVESLIPCENLRELYLTGNPVAAKPGYREFVICTLPQLAILDGVPITKSDRLRAQQTFLAIKATAAHLPVVVPDIPDPDALDAIDAEMDANFNGAETTSHSPASRMVAARQLAKMRDAKDPEKVAAKDREERRRKKEEARPSRIAKDGRVFQCNEPGVTFAMVETQHSAPAFVEEEDAAGTPMVILTVHVSKFIATELLDVEMLDPVHVRVSILGKLLQLKLPAAVDGNRLMCVRSQATGALVVYMARHDARPGVDMETMVRAWQGAERLRERQVAQEKQQAARLVRESAERKLQMLGQNQMKRVDSSLLPLDAPTTAAVAPAVDDSAVDEADDDMPGLI
ncbi:hypothetical protein BC828DRAFT_415354 [Blastocladiella britannica]|nr:hypothetical protein BC828DRAFT_415354 [Blastocladiella britannica]